MARKVCRVVKRTLAVTLTLIVVAIIGGLGYRAYREHAIAAALASIQYRASTTLFVRIGGIEQWISISGRNRDNPVLLLLHGGPGMASSFLPRDSFFSWTRDFTVVRWDQRGAGRSYGRSGAVPQGTTIDRIAQDGIEVAEFPRAKVHKPKILLLGLSWGSMLGTKIAHERPPIGPPPWPSLGNPRSGKVCRWCCSSRLTGRFCPVCTRLAQQR